jgi:hypothetical protein
MRARRSLSSRAHEDNAVAHAGRQEAQGAGEGRNDLDVVDPQLEPFLDGAACRSNARCEPHAVAGVDGPAGGAGQKQHRRPVACNAFNPLAGGEWIGRCKDRLQRAAVERQEVLWSCVPDRAEQRHSRRQAQRTEPARVQGQVSIATLQALAKWPRAVAMRRAMIPRHRRRPAGNPRNIGLRTTG